MNRGRILFRADASHALGFGHIARLCALIEETSTAGFEALALFDGEATAIRAWARDRKLAVDVREWTAAHVVRLAEDSRVRAVVIDGLPIANDIIPKLPKGVRSVLIDDNCKSLLEASTVVNHNVHAPEQAAGYPLCHQRLLGRQYLMLRRDIRRYTRGSCRPTPASRLRVLVTFGGSDPVGATIRVMKLLPPDRPLEVVVVAGPGFRDESELPQAIAIAEANGHTVDVRRSPDDPGSLFVSADAAICSAGGTLGELAFLGCPALAYAIVADQLTPARKQVREGLISGGRRWSDTDDDTLRSDMLAFVLDDQGRRDQRQRALATADSDGPRRIIEAALG